MGKYKNKELGDFLKKRREKILPSEVGISQGIRRRTSGLRREEVASLSGVGVSWYTWLEQGKDIRVSTEVLDSISRTLKLNEEEREYIYSLMNKIPIKQNYEDNYEISSSLQNVLDNLVLCPAFIIDNRWNVLKWNEAARVVFADFDNICRSERNIVWMMFNNEKYKNLFCDWEDTAKGMISRFRSMSDKYIEDPWMIDFIETMKKSSEEFVQLWSKHEIQGKSNIKKYLNHSNLGELSFEMSSFQVQDNRKLNLIINTPDKKDGTDIKLKNALKV